MKKKVVVVVVVVVLAYLNPLSNHSFIHMNDQKIKEATRDTYHDKIGKVVCALLPSSVEVSGLDLAPTDTRD